MASVMVAPPQSRLSPPEASSSATGTASKQSTFEFTRRKRWAELLVNELSEAIGLVLSPTGRILFCTPSVTELLGWRDQELIDADFGILVNVDDQNAFQNSLASAIQQHTDVLAYARLRCKDPAVALQTSFTMNQLGVGGIGDYGYSIPTAGSSTSIPAQPPQMLSQAMAPPPSAPKEVLFEITGYPHFVEPDDDEKQRSGMMSPQCKCVFAVAKPYPSRNTAMLNTFLELKMENERLQQRLVDIKSRPRSAPTTSTTKRSRTDRNSAQQQTQHPSLSPIITHPYSHHSAPSAQLPQPSPSAYSSMPVSMQIPMSSLSATPGGSSTGNAYPQTSYASSSNSFYAPTTFGDYGVGLGLGSAGGGYTGYGQSAGGPSSGLAALAIASAVAATPQVSDRRMSFSAPSGATDHRRMSLPGGSVDRGGDEEEGGRKKKVRRHVGEQFVCRTCGRTDSPEWRKGPLGPKTLCNACGLRWAKQIRKGDDKEKDEGGE